MKIAVSEDQIVRLKLNLKKQGLNEDFLDDIISKGAGLIKKGVEAGKEFIAGLDVPSEKKATDIPSKADFVSADVDKLYEILSNIDQPIGEQKYGSMTRQQTVEAVQVGLQLLGYKLPRFGTDGLFGPETAAAVRKYKVDNNIIETVSEAFVEIGDVNYSNVKVDNDTRYDQVNDALLSDLQSAAESAGVVVTITTASTGHSKKTINGNESRHGFGTAVDIALLNGVGVGNKRFKEYGDKLKDALVSMGYTWNSEGGNPKAVLWQTNTGGNHYNHLHVSNKEGVSGSSANKVDGETITPIMVDSMVEKLKEKNITNNDIAKYVDPAVTSGGGEGFTDLNLNDNSDVESYKKICDNYILSRDQNARVTGDMMADAAERVFKKYGKYVPPELALAQLTLEGGIGSSNDSIPMRTKNPFNIGNTGSKTNTLGSFKEGVDLYYDLIARKYLVRGKTATDLVRDFRNAEGNSYAEAGTYEAGLKKLIASIRRKNEPIYASIAQRSKQNISEELLNEADKRQAIKNALGFNQDWADEFHRMSDKLSVWIASTFLNKLIETIGTQAPAGDDRKEFVVNMLNEQSPNQGHIWINNYKDKYEYILHWLRAPRREPLNVRDLTFDSAYQQAEEWHESLQIRKQSNYQEQGEVFIDYRNSDGVGYYWVHLHKNYCGEEADRMGHCARSNSGQLISFRKINEFGEGESYLTVDYRPGGVIGDFHRHGNKKPTARFHNQIVDFLINTTYPVTSLVSQGVHRYEDNFQLRDLSAADLKRVYDANPSLRFNINDENSWPEIINAILSGEVNFDQYPSNIKLRLLKKSTSLRNHNELLTKFTDDVIVRILSDVDSLNNAEKTTYVAAFGDKLNDILKRKFDLVYDASSSNEAKEHFIDSLRAISQDFFDYYRSFCDYIDYGFTKFNEQNRVEIVASRGIKRTLFACTDTIPFLSRYSDNTPIDMNGNISVKTEEGLWGLVKQNGETILHPEFAAIAPNPMDRGKTYMVKNRNGEFFKLNLADMSYTKFERKR